VMEIVSTRAVSPETQMSCIALLSSI